jgi:hypothetical protein
MALSPLCVLSMVLIVGIGVVKTGQSHGRIAFRTIGNWRIPLLTPCCKTQERAVLKASCLCGGIEFEFEDIPGRVLNCHCSLCRKSHGVAFATQAFAKRHTL